MKRTLALVAGAVLVAVVTYLFLPAKTDHDPAYDSAETERVILQMVEAHGGLDTWRAAPTISYDNVFFNPFAETERGKWWVAHEVIDQITRRAYQDWPIDGSVLAYDGDETWTTNWVRGNPPKMMVHFFYYFVNLPWLTQDNDVIITRLGESRLPGFEKNYLTFEMRFTQSPTVGKTARDFFKLYVDPDTYVLQGYEYSMGYGALLDAMGVPDGEIFGPMLRVHDVFAEVDGLRFPSQFHTMSPDGETTYGNHVIINHSISEPFDDARVKRPADGVIDQSSAERGQGTSPRSLKPDTQVIIERMIEAHGGVEKWRSASSVSYEHEMIDPSEPDDPWLSKEVVEQGRRRSYHEWPLDGAFLAYDGERVWTKNWGRSNPPGMMAFVAYFFLNLPWITHDEGVRLGPKGQKSFPENAETAPGADNEYHVIRMTYDPETTGASPYEYYDLYIDSETYLLKGVEYTVTYRPLMDLFEVPDSVKFMGPLFKVYLEHTDVDGLVFPTRYDTYRGGQVYGIHTVENYSIRRPFDAARLEMPDGAVIDKTFGGS